MRGRDAMLELLRDFDARAGAIPVEDLMSGLGGLSLSRADLGGAVVFDDRTYQRVVIGRRPHYEALVLCWRSGQGSPIHDHAGSSRAVLVVEGCATETLYRPSPCGRLVPAGSHAIRAGERACSSQRVTHQMANLEPPGQDLITLHLYSPPPGGWRYYSLAETTLAGHDGLASLNRATILADLGHAIPGPSRGVGVRGGRAWKP